MVDPSHTGLFIATRIGAGALVEIARPVVGDRRAQEVGARRTMGAGCAHVAASVSDVACAAADGDAGRAASSEQQEQQQQQQAHGQATCKRAAQPCVGQQ